MSQVNGSCLTLVRKTEKANWSVYRCVCGTEKEIRDGIVSRGGVKSCGCKARTVIIKHGRCFTKEYRAWAAMRDRCYREKHIQYERYGGRGIKVCQRWIDSFENFLKDVGDAQKGQFIDRIDNDKGYWCGKAECPECGPLKRESNCRWVSAKTSARNRSNSRMITFGGRTLHLTDWAEVLRVSIQSLSQMIKRRGEQEALEVYTRQLSLKDARSSGSS